LEKRTVGALLQVMGLSQERRFRAITCSQLQAMVIAPASRICSLDCQVFAPGSVLVMGIGDTLVPARANHDQRRLSRSGTLIRALIEPQSQWFAVAELMLLVEVSWAQQVWALPFLTVLAPSGAITKHSRRQSSPDWAGSLRVRRAGCQNAPLSSWLTVACRLRSC